MSKNEIQIYTDGSSLGNPGPGGFGAVFVFPEGKVKELGGREEETTNNRMELRAVCETLRVLGEGEGATPATIYMDSKYVLNGVTTWVYVWEKNGWMTKGEEPVKNSELWKNILENLRVVKQSREIGFEHVPGHADHPGNERADTIARSFSEGKAVELFEGALAGSSLAGVDLSIDYDELKKKKVKKDRSRAQAYSYLSLVNGKLEKHATWAECEARVKGTKGAKFKKALSKEDEEEILIEWGVM